MNKRVGFGLISILFLLIIPITFMYTQTATLVDFKGKVELMKPGAAWTKAVKGMRIDKGMTISTGFNSQATLQLGDSTVLAKALTRLTLEELVRKENTVQTSLFLKVGKVRAEVKSSEGLAIDFKLKSPISTAAVRGTTIEGDGENTICRGVNAQIVVTSASGEKRTIGNGEQSKVSESEAPKTAEQIKVVIASLPPAPGAPVVPPAPPAPPPPPLPGRINFSFTWPVF